MRIVENRSAWVLIDTARLHANEAVLADIDNADTITCTDLIEFRQQFDCPHLLTVDSNGDPFLKGNGDILRRIRCILRCTGDEEHGVLRLVRRILEV